MRGILTQEGLDSLRWYASEHPIKLGEKRNKLEIFLRFTGLNQLNPRPSDEKILRLYREKQIKAELREGNSIYNGVPSGLRSVAGYFIDMLNKGRVNSRLMGLERDDEIAEDVIMSISYMR